MGPKYLSLLYSISDKPLEYWSKHVTRSGRIRKVVDVDLLENVIEIQDLEQPNACNTSVTCPREPSQLLHIELPILVIVMKNLDINFRLQLQVIDSLDCSHRFLFTNADFEKNTNPNRIVFSRVKLKLEPNWNKLEFNLVSMMKNTLHRDYKATQRMEICANCRVRKVYFIDKHYEVNEVCPKLYDGFLDTYMLKWGINLAETAAQTENKYRKAVTAEPNKKNSQKKVQGNEETLAENNDFLKKLRAASDKVIDDFFAKQSMRLAGAEDFKSHAKIKSYVIPKVNLKQTPAANFFSKDIFEKADVLRRFTEMHIPSNQKCNENSLTNSKLQEPYGVNLKSMLQFKPRSAFHYVNRDTQESAGTEPRKAPNTAVEERKKPTKEDPKP